jgi:hypothetical protein
MTPQEKAEEIIRKYSTYVVMWAGGVETERENVKQCALIAVDEIIKFMEMDDEHNDCLYFANSKWVQYLIEVKQEIEKL